MIAVAVADESQSCPICAEVAERSRLYGTWLVNENYGDSATLERVAQARGFCSAHARRIAEASPYIPISVARFALRAIAHAVRAQFAHRSGYRDALDARGSCPWCDVERAALAPSLRSFDRARFCLPHARLALRRDGLPDSPQPPCRPLDPPSPRNIPSTGTGWWSPAIETLWQQLQLSCPSCLAAREASERREAFLRRGPASGEHWDVPVLCVAHDAQLGKPRSSEFVYPLNDVPRECDWCAVAARAERRTAELAAIAFTDPSFRDAYSRTAGFCLPHARLLLAHLNEGDARRTFVNALLARIETMLWELDEWAARSSWNLREQGTPRDAAALAAEAWWLLAGGVWHRFAS